MRAYFFGNMYLSSIQQGIQAQHCTVAMYNKYLPRPTEVGECCFDASEQSIQLTTWAHDHEVDILLSGGYSETLHEIYAGFNNEENPYPFAKFHEANESLNNALTCVGIILPDAIYETAAEVRAQRGNYGRTKVDEFNLYGEWKSESGLSYTFTKFQVWLINELNKYGLAR